ncbi:MAG TPA: site-specific integrase [Azonexus sp.]|nr:site-specific integrase [Azonexus sp.]
MTKPSVATGNITNRSPWAVSVRARPDLDRSFSAGRRPDAARYCADLCAAGHRAQLTQLETAFQLRVRRQGMAPQFITFDTPDQAEQARLHIEANLSVSIVRDYASAARWTLRELMQRYLVEVVPGHKGADVETNRLQRLMRDEPFVDKKLAALATVDLQDFIAERLADVAPATVDRDLDLISQVLRYADDVWKIAPVESPFKGLRRPRYCNERDRRLSADEECRLLAAARADENHYVEAAIVLALETAMRRSELLALTVADIDVERRAACLRNTKNGRPRRVPLTTRALQVITELVTAADPIDGHLLPLTANALKIAFFRRVLPASGVADFHFHDLRHEAISRLAESRRFQLLQLQAISGHRDPRMVQRYAHLCTGRLAEQMDGIRVGSVTKYVHRGRRRTVVKTESLDPPVRPARSASGGFPANVIRVNFGGHAA